MSGAFVRYVRTPGRQVAAQADAVAAIAINVAAARQEAAHPTAPTTARKAARKAVPQSAGANLTSVAAPAGSPRQIAVALLAEDGWAGQFSCLDALWARESGWNVYAQNPSSGAYGIPQAMPGSKMASAGPDWQGNAATQIRWGLSYIRSIYGTPCGAWSHEEAVGWY